MQRLFRRMGGLRRLVFIGIGIISIFYIFQSYIFSKGRQEGSLLPSEERKIKGHLMQFIKPKCNLDSVCGKGQYSFRIVSGKEYDPPMACLEDVEITQENGKFGPGLNIIVIEDDKKAITHIRHFETSKDDVDLLKFLEAIPEHHVILIASWDNVVDKLTDATKSLLEQFGSRHIQSVRSGDSFVLLGQKGISPQLAVERVGLKGSKTEKAEVGGCFQIPLGEPWVYSQNSIRPTRQKIKAPSFEDSPNCGLPKPCGKDFFAIHVYTGKDHNDEAKLCLDGKYIMGKRGNNTARGMNLVLIDGGSKEVLRFGQFDTYQEDSTLLEMFLEDTQMGDIIISFTFDEASLKLSDLAKKLFFELGSALIQNMKFRSGWFIVGQKGIEGFTQYEELTFPEKGGWADVIDRRMCIPHQIVGLKIRPDPVPRKNPARRTFCSKYEGYGDFCSDKFVDEQLLPAPITNKSLVDHPIYSIPIIVIPGLSHNSLRMSLETLIRQPGIQPPMVRVISAPILTEAIELASLFNFKHEVIHNYTSYREQMEKAIDKAWEIFSDKKFLIILEEELVLSSDFLYYMAQMLPILDRDNSIISISAWNDNGYEEVSSNPNIAYRVEQFPGLAFMIKRNLYESDLRGKWKRCCQNRAWDGWLTDKLNGREIIIPDVSRVLRRPFEGLVEDPDYIEGLFGRSRITNLTPTPWISNGKKLYRSDYEQHLEEMLNDSLPVISLEVMNCAQNPEIKPNFAPGMKRNYAIYYEQEDGNDQELLRLVCRCFGLFSIKGHRAKGLHKGLLRFTYKENNILVIGSLSPYYQSKPISHQPLSKS